MGRPILLPGMGHNGWDRTGAHESEALGKAVTQSIASAGLNRIQNPSASIDRPADSAARADAGAEQAESRPRRKVLLLVVFFALALPRSSRLA